MAINKIDKSIPRTGPQSLNGDLIPSTDGRWSIGRSDRRIARLYVKELIAESTVSSSTISETVENADTVDFIHASTTPTANYLYPLNSGAVYPTTVYPQALLLDGSRSLSADWDAGSYKITARQLESDVTTGTAPLVIASTTVVNNLNADEVDGYDGSELAALAENETITGTWTFPSTGFNVGADVTVNRNAANILGLASGDSIKIPSDGYLYFGDDVQINRASANVVQLAAGDSLLVSATGSVQFGSTISLGYNADNRLELATGDSLSVPGNIRAGASGAASALLEAYGTSIQMQLSYDGSNYATFAVGTGGNLTLRPIGDLILDPDGQDVLPEDNYDVSLGKIDKKYLSLYAAELWVETLVAQSTIATIGGRIIVAPTTTLTLFLDSADTEMEVKHNQIERNDIQYMEANSNVEFLRSQGIAIKDADDTNDWFIITGDYTSFFTDGTKFTVVESTGNDDEWTCDGNSTYSGGDTTIPVLEDITDGTNDGYILYTGSQEVGGPFLYLNLDRNMDASGANDWYAGDAMVNTGKSTNNDDGFIDLYSIQGVDNTSSNGPTIVGNVRQSTTYNDWTESWAIGNLNGLYGQSSDKYGIGLGKYAIDTEYITILPGANGIQFYSDNQVHAQLTGSAWTMGYVSGGEYVQISSSGIEMYSGGDKTINMDAATSDVTLGKVETDSANIFWDADGGGSTGQLKFRGGTNGTVTEAYIDTDGSIRCGGGTVKLDSDGIDIEVSTSYSSTRAYRLIDTSSNDIFSLQGQVASGDNYVRAFTESVSGRGSYLLMGAALPSSEVGEVSLGVYKNSAYVSSIRMVSNALDENSMEIDVEGDIDIEFDGTLDIRSDTYSVVNIDATNGHSIFYGSIGINRSTFTDITQGLVIDQEGNDDHILQLHSDDVNHTGTAIAPTTCYGLMSKLTAGAGGLAIAGLRDSASGSQGISLFGYILNSANTDKDGTARSIVEVSGSQIASNDVANVAANGNVFGVRAQISGAQATVWFVDVEGDMYRDGSTNTFDEYDDAIALRDLSKGLSEGWNDWLMYNKESLRDMGVIAYSDDAPRPMVSQKKLDALLVGGVTQNRQKIDEMARQLAVMETALEQLGVDTVKLLE